MPPLVRTATLLTLAGLAAAVPACGGDDGPTPRHDTIGPALSRQPATELGPAHNFDVERFATGLTRPTYVGAAPGDAGALWVLEQPGRVVRLADGQRTIALDMTDQVKTGAEQGLLGIAFHPDFAVDRRLYLHWTDRAGDTRVAEFRARPDWTLIPRPTRWLLHVKQPEENHNGGQLAFGPDGRLYLGLGDGGGAFDPHRSAQDLGRHLGKIIALQLDDDRARWDVVAYGLRNPWRFSFDIALGELWIADVGQDEIEEVNRIQLEPDEPPKNLGWSTFEGTRRVSLERRINGDGEVIWPVATYTHADGCSITGGFVYRGTALPTLSDRYLYGDFCAGILWSLASATHGRATDVRRERARVPQLTHIGEDDSGEPVFASATGALYRATPASP
jgi:glucose/arabinose dehydrogenase